MQHRVYLAGPIESAGGNLNEPLFDFAAKQLRKQGCEVFNPWDLTRELIGPLSKLLAMSKEERKQTRRGLLAKELIWIIGNATVVAMLPDWQKSPGAKAEHAVAVALDIPIFEIPGIVSLMQDDINIDLAEEVQ